MKSGPSARAVAAVERLGIALDAVDALDLQERDEIYATTIARRLQQHERRVNVESMLAAIAKIAHPHIELVDVAIFARDRSLSVSMVRKLIRSNRLAAEKIGRSVRVRRDAVIAVADPTATTSAGAESPSEFAARILRRDAARYATAGQPVSPRRR